MAASEESSMVVFSRGLLAMVPLSHSVRISPEPSRVELSNGLPSKVVLMAVVFSKPVCSMVKLRKVEFRSPMDETVWSTIAIRRVVTFKFVAFSSARARNV